jgi:ABC-type phosphate transport system auxiliary subunit
VPDLSNPLFGLFGAGGTLALLGTLLTNRSGRQREFDSRVDKALERSEADNLRLEKERDDLREKLAASQKECRDEVAVRDAENRTLSLETVRLRRLLVENGIEPDPSISRGH